MLGPKGPDTGPEEHTAAYVEWLSLQLCRTMCSVGLGRFPFIHLVSDYHKTLRGMRCQAEKSFQQDVMKWSKKQDHKDL
ncbi:hypothetical protein WJX84_009460 [Apatococcus fuscideae]|uniref:Uncharacterized protein n=1 Tax=Apatococcus fuscideae TaxID=2026836 RepID=A0AAW1T666_9CHLO